MRAASPRDWNSSLAELQMICVYAGKGRGKEGKGKFRERDRDLVPAFGPTVHDEAVKLVIIQNSIIAMLRLVADSFMPVTSISTESLREHCVALGV